ncbi:efflux RND transporter permease subunit, partial [Lishizhenia sp.]|uniref:efflux RND transporter permease subunit n=1 Tax=Lishizhenia sp. TaxID=2497594 RepID=UPI00299E546F
MDDKKFKVFGLSSWAVNNRKTVFLIMMIIIIGGMGAYTSMPKENFPELQIPEIYVGIAKPGSSPAYMSEKIAEAIEKEVASIKYLDEINSNSIHGYTTLSIKFDFKMEAADALTKVKDAIDKARSKTDFPDLPVEPNVFELDPAQMPIMNINLRGDNPVLLKETAEILEDMIEDLPEINEVDIRGVQEQEMRIEVDRLKAEAVNVTLDDIERAVSSEHQIISGGEILMDGWRKTLRIDGEFDNAQQLANIIVKQDELMPVYLKDVAEVYFGNADTTSYAREFGVPVVMLDVKKQAGENLLEASEKIEKILADCKADKTISPSIAVSIANDQSDKTRDMVSNLENSIIFGILLVVIVLLFFLGGRNAMFVGVAIPLSMFMSFLILSAMGVTLNVMVLFSLVLALGMLVDNGIVVVENVYRFIDEEKMDPFKAAIYGVGEVAWPIIASTATTLAAFIPLAIWPGMMGEFMKYLPITLMIVLGSSLFVALVINPVLTALYMKVEEDKPNTKKSLVTASIFIVLGLLSIFGGAVAFGNILALVGITILVNMFVFVPGTKTFQNKFLPKLERMYKRFLEFALRGRNPVFFIVGTILMLVISIALVGAFQPKVVFFPENQPNMVHVYVSHPIGTDIKVTNKTVVEVEKRVNELLQPYYADTAGKPKDAQLIQSVITQVGEGATDPNDMSSMGSTPHKGKVTVSFAEFQYRDTIETSKILKEIQEGMKGQFTAEIEVSVDKNKDGPPLPPAINMEVTGKGNYKDVIIAATEIKNFLDRKAVPGVDKLKLNVDATRPEIPIVVDRDKVRKLNSSTTAVGMAIRKALLGQDISTYTKDEETYDIVVRFKKEDRDNLDALLDQKLIFRNNKGQILRIPIRSVIEDPKENISYTAVVRKDQVPMVVVSSNTAEGYNGNEVVEELKNAMNEYV